MFGPGKLFLEIQLILGKKCYDALSLINACIEILIEFYLDYSFNKLHF